MQSKDVYTALEAVRKAINSKQSIQDIDLLLNDLQEKLLSEGISKEVIEAQLTAFREAFLEKTEPNEDTLRAEIKRAVHNADFNRCNLRVYRALLPYTKLMYAIEKNGVAEEHAYKLAVLFDNEDKAFNYLTKFIKMNPNILQPMHDALVFGLPEDEWDLNVWRKLCAKYMNEDLFRKELLPNMAELEFLIKVKNDQNKKKIAKGELIKQITEKTKEIETTHSRFKKLHGQHGALSEEEKQEHDLLAQELLKKRTEFTALGVPFNDQLTLTGLMAFKILRDTQAQGPLKYFFEHGLTQNDFKKFVKLERKDDPVQIPNIKIDGKDLGHPDYYLMKIDVMDELEAARAACLGNLTNCCQLFGDNGEPCTIHGLTSPYGGFYILCKGDVNAPKIDDPLLGQCWAWRSQSSAIVFDSIEVPKPVKHNNALKIIVSAFFEHLGKTLVNEGHTKKVACGRNSGISKLMGVRSVFNPKEQFIDYSEYCDSEEQNVIYDSEYPFYFYGKDEKSTQRTEDIIKAALQNGTPLATNKAFAIMMNWALLEKRNDILEKAREIAVDENQLENLDIFLEKINKYSHKHSSDEFLADLDEKNTFVDMRNSDGHTPLLRAVMYYDNELCLELIKRGADVNAKSANGYTPLLGTAMLPSPLYNDRFKDLYIMLIEHGADIHARSYDGYTSLLLAAKHNHLELCLKLIELGVDVNTKNDDGDTPLLQAIKEGHADICLMLIENRADVNTENDKGDTPLLLAIRKGLSEVCLKLIEKEVDINAEDDRGNTPLQLAIEKGLSHVCLKLIENGADVNAENYTVNTPLLLAIKKGLNDVCLALIKRGADINTEVFTSSFSFTTPLQLAIANGLSDVCLNLIENGADINAENANGDTPLSVAAKEGLDDVCSVLIEKGVKINNKSRWGYTPLLLATINGHANVCLMLIKNGADVNAKNHYDHTLLSLAITSGLSEVCLALIKNGADVDAKDSDGNTPLSLATKAGLNEVCLKLEQILKSRAEQPENIEMVDASYIPSRKHQRTNDDENGLRRSVRLKEKRARMGL